MSNKITENARLIKLQSLEKKIYSQGFTRIAGVDEAGRGPLAGPVVAAACVIPKGVQIPHIDDSKKLLPSKRYEIFQQILNTADLDYGIGIVDALMIDQLNILQATFQAMLAAIAALKVAPDFLLVDGNQLPPTSISSSFVIKGDSRCYSIAAASIIAKETRDELMQKYHLQWPEYGFKDHKGYGTKKHCEALKKHGPCPLHRLTFAKVL